MNPILDPNLLSRLSNQLSRGEIILFTGAGFSAGAKSRSGTQLPGAEDLKVALWAIAFPGEPFDQSSTLGDIYDAALQIGSNRTKALLEERLRVDASTLPAEYGAWLSMPWARVYTLNVDDLDEAVSRTFQIPRKLQVVSALKQEPMTSREAMLSIHLNGKLDDFPDITFSQRQYGERAAQPDLWYQVLVRDLHTSPVLFIGTTLDEPPLWQHIELRGKRGEGRELRPGSYLVTPNLSAARKAILEHHFNVTWIPMRHEDFASEVFGQLVDAQRLGIEAISLQTQSLPVSALLKVSELRSQPTQDLREYLMGRQPVWADFGPQGFAVHREFEDQIEKQLLESGGRALLLTGTGGAGKSTTLMRFGLQRQAAGQDVRWVNMEAEIPLGRLRTAIRESGADILLIDDLDSFGTSAGPLLVDVLEASPKMTVAATIRATRYEALRIEQHLVSTPFTQLSIPHLKDNDVDLLLDALTRAQRLGRLRSMTREQQVAAFKREAGRQLLVAMIETTSGQRFDEKINSECRELDPETAFMYAVIALATAENQYLTNRQILLACADPSNKALNRLQGLLNQHLLVDSGGGRIRLRHRVVAEKAVAHFQSENQLAEPIRGLMFALASGIDRAHYPRDREGRFLVRIINHEWLIRHLPANQRAVRAAYDAIEPILNWDYHYWLQRGSFEVHVGDLQLAQNFLEQARGLGPNDYRVQTEWAYMVIKRAVQDPLAPDARDRVDEAVNELEDAVIRRGDQDAYPAHIMGSQGLSWIRHGPLTHEEKLALLRRLRHVVDSALESHPGVPDLRQLSRDLEEAYLLIGAVEDA